MRFLVPDKIEFQLNRKMIAVTEEKMMAVTDNFGSRGEEQVVRPIVDNV